MCLKVRFKNWQCGGRTNMGGQFVPQVWGYHRKAWSLLDLGRLYVCKKSEMQDGADGGQNGRNMLSFPFPKSSSSILDQVGVKERVGSCLY